MVFPFHQEVCVNHNESNLIFLRSRSHSTRMGRFEMKVNSFHSFMVGSISPRQIWEREWERERKKRFTFETEKGKKFQFIFFHSTAYFRLVSWNLITSKQKQKLQALFGDPFNVHFSSSIFPSKWFTSITHKVLKLSRGTKLMTAKFYTAFDFA